MSEQRRERGLTQRLFLLSTEKTSENCIQFKVSGSTGNIYNICLFKDVTKKTTCTCPDYRNRLSKCKHIFFILERVLAKSSNRWKEASRILKSTRDIPICNDEDSRATAEMIQQALKCRKLNEQDKSSSEPIYVSQKSVQDEDCGVCLEAMDAEKEPLVWCKTGCGKSMHEQCYHQLDKFTKGSSKCPYCRKPFPHEKDPNEYENIEKLIRQVSK